MLEQFNKDAKTTFKHQQRLFIGSYRKSMTTASIEKRTNQNVKF